MSRFDANVQAISLSMIPKLYRGHSSAGIPFIFTYVCRLLVTFRGRMFPITLHVQLLYHFLMIILLSYQPSDLQRSPTYYYRYIALLSFRDACFMAIAFIFLRYFGMLHWIDWNRKFAIFALVLTPYIKF